MAAWLKRHEKKLTVLWHEGITAEKIAVALGPGFTKNAVIGKARRLGLKKRRHYHVKGGGKSRFKRARPMPKWKARQAMRLPPKPPSDILPPENCTPVTILERSLDQCAFSVGNGLFCGAPVYVGANKHGEEKRSSWCAYHWNVCYGRKEANGKAERINKRTF